mmetsp:Transcript_6913/g.21559  ORF Transcript_6913/g.21559 Transcript_6913/m.21559 type:complete len:250 (+) Transcript_6913:91-840(+)
MAMRHNSRRVAHSVSEKNTGGGGVAETQEASARAEGRGAGRPREPLCRPHHAPPSRARHPAPPSRSGPTRRPQETLSARPVVDLACAARTGPSEGRLVRPVRECPVSVVRRRRAALAVVHRPVVVGRRRAVAEDFRVIRRQARGREPEHPSPLPRVPERRGRDAKRKDRLAKVREQLHKHLGPVAEGRLHGAEGAAQREGEDRPSLRCVVEVAARRVAVDDAEERELHRERSGAELPLGQRRRLDGQGG